MATSKERVAADAIADIEDLADPKWAGRVCSRKGSHVYNRSLMASILAANGPEVAAEWAQGLVANFARDRRAMTARRPRPFSKGNATSSS